jgi:methylthioribulose-1-phosphate dehydratase
MHMTRIAQVDTLLEIIRIFNDRGWSMATSTNYSFRNPTPQEDTFTISVSGVDKSKFGLHHLMEIDAQAKPLPGYEGLRSSAETLLHTQLYENPNIGAVLHTHSVAGTVLSRIYAAQGGLVLEGFEMLKGLDNIQTHDTSVWLPIFANAQEMEPLSAEVRKYMAQNPQTQGYLLAGHGLYTWGRTLEEAKRKIEVLEFLMECVLQLRSWETT